MVDQQVLQFGDVVVIGDLESPGLLAADQGIKDSVFVCKMVREGFWVLGLGSWVDDLRLRVWCLAERMMACPSSKKVHQS